MYISGDSVLHLATRAENEKAAIFLATNGAKSSLSNLKVGILPREDASHYFVYDAICRDIKVRKKNT